MGLHCLDESLHSPLYKGWVIIGGFFLPLNTENRGENSKRIFERVTSGVLINRLCKIGLIETLAC